MAQALPKSYKAAVVEAAGKPFVVKDFPLSQPSSREIVIKVIACGVCHSDGVLQEGQFGDVFPRIPGRAQLRGRTQRERHMVTMDCRARGGR